MRNRFALGFLAVAVWLCSSAAAWAVALGKIDVASHLGERFYAEVPLQLDHGEKLANIDVSLASPADYRILEIYRDPALDAIQAEVKNDKRGPRVVLSSKSGVSTPFFNLVLKVRYERATHFKKYPIFLDIPKIAQPAKIKPLPSVTEGAAAKAQAKPAPAATAAPVAVAAKPAAAPKPGSTFKPYDGWARIGRYGPLVYGDSVSTVAKRLRIDDRYTFAQVMVALFEKNRSKFDHDNINLIRAGTTLNVPKAAEVERISPAEASRFMAKQEKAWKQLIKQPKYAAVAEAQKHRYSKRVRMGEKAAGEAAAPVATKAKPAAATPAKPAAPTAASASGAGSAVQQQLQQLQQQNAALQDKLNATQKQLTDASAKSSAANAAAVAAADAKIKKLQIQLARLQAERSQALRQAESRPSPLGWLTYALVAVVVLLLAIIGFLMRRERTHPATEYAMPESTRESTGTAPESESGFRAGLDEPEGEPEGEPEDFSEHVMFEPEESEAAEPEATEGAEATQEPEAAQETEAEESVDDSVPELTEEDTGRMEAFEQAAGDQADPNVDYLAEADVYLRYGMDDEAIQQVRMALQLDAANADAHIKMVQLMHAKEDQAGLDEAVAAARQALQGDALTRFEEAVSMSAGAAMAEATGGEPAAEAAGEADTEWPDFEDAEVPEAESATETGDEAGTAEAEAEAAAETEAVASGGAFDLSDIDIPEPAADAMSESGLEMDTGDLEKTVAITRPRDEIEFAEAESMFEEETPAAEEPAAAEDASAPEAAAEGEPEAQPATDSGAELDLGDLDFDQVDLDQAVASGSDDDEFSGTIRKTLAETGEGEAELPELDLSSELEATPAGEAEGEGEAEPAQADEDKDANALDLGDVDAVHDELNNLLDELADEAEKDGDDKKES